jgi:hypothetical protein
VAKKKQALARGDIIRIGAQWFHLNLDWGNGELFLATPLSSPTYPERYSLGPPHVLKVTKPPDAVLRQADLGGYDVDPLKGSGR